MKIVLGKDLVEIVMNEELEMLASIVQDDEKMAQIIKTFAGCNIYVPNTLNKVLMYEQIYLGFVQLVEKGGYSKTQAAHILAQRHGLSARRIRAIIKDFIDEHGEEYAAELKALSACDGTESACDGTESACDGTESACEESVQASDGASLHQ